MILESLPQLTPSKFASCINKDRTSTFTTPTLWMNVTKTDTCITFSLHQTYNHLTTLRFYPSDSTFFVTCSPSVNAGTVNTVPFCILAIRSLWCMFSNTNTIRVKYRKDGHLEGRSKYIEHMCMSEWAKHSSCAMRKRLTEPPVCCSSMSPELLAFWMTTGKPFKNRDVEMNCILTDSSISVHVKTDGGPTMIVRMTIVNCPILDVICSSLAVSSSEILRVVIRAFWIFRPFPKIHIDPMNLHANIVNDEWNFLTTNSVYEPISHPNLNMTTKSRPLRS